MIVILTSLSMLFATLLLGYAVYRVSSEVWPPHGFDRLPLEAPLLSTAVVLASSYYYFRFSNLWSRNLLTESRKHFALCLLLAVSFIFSQLNLWSKLKQHELFSSSGIFGSMIYGFTWIHFGHMVLALGLLLWLSWFVYRNKKDNRTDLLVVNIGKFWHFLSVIWLIMFLALFVI